MTTTNRLCYTVSKRYIQAGTTFEINVKILLADDCKNNICDCKKKQQKAENEKRVMLAVLDAGLSVCNVIYYDHSNELDFNIAFGEYKDGLCKDGIISQSLYERATLY